MNFAPGVTTQKFEKADKVAPAQKPPKRPMLNW